MIKLPSHLITKDNYWEWRQELKLYLLKKRRYRSDYSGKKLTEETGCHMHEALVTRAMIPTNVSWFGLIHDERNVLLLLPEEHIPQPPSKEWGIHKLFELYGEEVIKDWYYGLPWRSKPPFKLP